MEGLRQKILDLNNQFASVGLKLYFVKELKDNLTGGELVRASKGNVLIETLPTGSLGLPTAVGRTVKILHESGLEIEILHSGVLLLTKMKRWYRNRDSTHPKTVSKRYSDRRDLDFLVTWLATNDMTIEFEEYEGTSKEKLLPFVQYYREQVGTDMDLMEKLRKATKPDDWALL